MSDSKSYTRIKNYTTTIKSEKTIAEIEKMLAVYGASKILKEYNDEGDPILLAFIIQTSKGEMPIKLPVNIEGVQSVFKKQVSEKRLPKSYWENKEQAMRVGWRIIKDWLDAQLTILNLEMVKIEEIFLPYIYDPTTNKTMYEKIEESGFVLPALTEGNKRREYEN